MVEYIITAKFYSPHWRDWQKAETYDDGVVRVVQLRERYPSAKFRLVERTITDVITYT